MIQEQQVPRNALAWIIISLFTLVAPHAARLPMWVLAVYGIAAGWRIMVYRGRWSFPGRRVKLALILTAFLGIFASYGSLLGLEPTVALLLTAFALKLIELAGRKDAYVLLFLGYFICITQFLFSQSLPVVLYSLCNVVLVTSALVALHRPGEHQFNRGSMRLAVTMLAQALPLMLVLFFLFPRIGPLWTVPVKSHTAKTGVSDFMQPGDIAQLSKSDAVAFRVQFDGPIPPRSELYWRGLVFSRLADGAWSSLPYYAIPARERRAAAVTTAAPPLQYRVILAPTQQHWLYSLRYARSSTPGVMSSADYRLFFPQEIEDDTLYSVSSWPRATLELQLSAWRRRTELSLPPGSNPRSRELAQRLRAAAASDAEFVDAVLTHLRTRGFAYTLQPPLLDGTHPMDQFLFRTRRGFCEHYAYAFVVLMRAAGVPARVVAGYQGGEINPVNRTVIVRQFDAHAWAEVWLPGEGWVRVDPTTSVSPERIEWGLEQALQAEGSFLADSPLSPLRYRRFAWVNQLRLRYDALAFQWQSAVVGFNSERQVQVLGRLLGEFSAAKFAALLLGTWALVLLPVALALLRRRQVPQLSALDRAYLQFCDKLAGRGVARAPGESPGRYAQRVVSALPASAAQVRQLTATYCDLAYAGREQTKTSLRQFAREVKAFRPRQ